MKLGMFVMPDHPPETSLYNGAQWDLQNIRWAEEYGFDEAWIGEHYFNPWQPCPAPDLLIAQALRETNRIRLGAGCHLLPCHHPLELASRVAYLDHLSQGRLNFGIGAASGKAEMKGFDMDEFPGQNREKMEEALDIILGLWDRDKPFDHKGKYWNVYRTDAPGTMHTSHLFPYQKPYPPIAIAGFSPKSPSLTLAGRHGFWPLSFDVNDEGLLLNWKSVEDGAAEAGRSANRDDWRIVRTIIVGDTDEQARGIASEGYLSRYWKDFSSVLWKEFGMMDAFKKHPGMSDEEVTPAYLAENCWLCGSPDTVVKGIEDLYELTGGFGVMVILGLDYSGQPEVWKRSMELMGSEVMPRLKHLGAKLEQSAAS